MINIIITLLLALGLLNSPEQWNNLSASEKADMTEIVIVDIGQE